MNMAIIAYYTLLKALRSPSMAISVLLLPLLLIYILGYALQDLFTPAAAPAEAVKLAVYSADEGPVADRLQSFLREQEERGELAVSAQRSRDDVVRKVAAKEAAFGLIVPAGFGASVARGGGTTWEFMPGGSSVGQVRAQLLLQSFADDLAAELAYGESYGQPGAAASAAPQPASHIVRVEPGSKGNNANALHYYAVHMLIMYVWISSMTAIGFFNTEKNSRTLDRLYATPMRPAHVAFGLFGGIALFSALLTAFLIASTSLLFGVDWGGRPLELTLVCLLMIALSVSVALLIAMLVPSLGTARMTYMLVILAMTFTSGGFNPAVSANVAPYDKLTFNYWIARSMLGMMQGADDGTLFRGIGSLGCLTAVALLVAMLAVYRKAGKR